MLINIYQRGNVEARVRQNNVALSHTLATTPTAGEGRGGEGRGDLWQQVMQCVNDGHVRNASFPGR